MARGRSKKAQAGTGGSVDQGAITGYEAEMWAMADALRGSMDASEYKHVVLGLIFLKYISDAFEERHAQLTAEQAEGADPEDPDEYRAVNVFWVPPEARWEGLQAAARQSDVGRMLDDAMVAIERQTPHPGPPHSAPPRLPARQAGEGHHHGAGAGRGSLGRLGRGGLTLRGPAGAAGREALDRGGAAIAALGGPRNRCSRCRGCRGCGLDVLGVDLDCHNPHARDRPANVVRNRCHEAIRAARTAPASSGRQITRSGR